MHTPVYVVLGVWTVVYLINIILLTYSRTSLHWAKFLHINGLSISFFQIKWYTVRFNRLFVRIANYKPSFWKIWFNMGIVVSLIGQVVAVLLLVTTLVDYFNVSKSTKKQILVPVVIFLFDDSTKKMFYNPKFHLLTE